MVAANAAALEKGCKSENHRTRSVENETTAPKHSAMDAEKVREFRHQAAVQPTGLPEAPSFEPHMMLHSPPQVAAFQAFFLALVDVPCAVLLVPATVAIQRIQLNSALTGTKSTMRGIQTKVEA